MVIADESGVVTIGGSSGSGQLQLKSSTGANSVFLDGGGTEALALLGGPPGQSGRIELFDGSARRTIDIDGRLGVLILGADGVDGDLSVLDGDGAQALVLNGDGRTLQLFSTASTKRAELDGVLGRLQLLNSAGVVTADLRGDSGLLVLGANGSDGDLTIKDGGGATTISCDGDTGHVECRTLTETSDARLKTAVAPLHRALDSVLALRGVRYQLARPAEAGADAGAEEIGFIGQELNAVFPELTATDSAGYTAVRYSRVTAVLVEAIKEQQQLIRDQAAALGAACQKISAIEASLAHP